MKELSVVYAYFTGFNLIVCLLIFFNGQPSYGQEKLSSPVPAHLQIDLPILDIPFDGSDGRYAFSMNQSVALSKSYYQITYPSVLGVLGLDRPEPDSRKTLLNIVLLVSYEEISDYLPLGGIWVHEEYHRAVLNNRNVDSYNNVYDLRLFGDNSVSVSRVKDEELVELKRRYPHDLIRSHAAGYEGDNQLVLALEKDEFFLGTSRAPLIGFVSMLGDHFYLRTTVSGEANTITDEFNRDEGTIAERDFTGLDFTAWVYDLFRPEEDYTIRGVHPSGVGIDRYIKLSDLTGEEIHFLKKQRDLSLLNFVNRYFFEVKPFKVKFSPLGKDVLLNIRPIHYLTSFGYTVNADFFIKTSDLNIFFSLMNQFNRDNYFPGVNVEVINYPVRFFGKAIMVTPRLSVWSQPEDQKFKTSKGKLGTLVAAKVNYPLGSRGWTTFVELEGKTPGWVAGNVFLDRNFTARTGVNLLF